MKSEATSPRAIEKVSGESFNSPRSSASFSDMSWTGTFLERITPIFQSRPASKRFIIATGNSVSGMTCRGPEPDAAAAATAPFEATMSGL